VKRLRFSESQIFAILFRGRCRWRDDRYRPFCVVAISCSAIPSTPIIYLIVYEECLGCPLVVFASNWMLPISVPTPVYSPWQDAAPLGAYVPLNGRTPQQLLARLAPKWRPFLLESGKGGDLARWSFLGGDPRLVLTSHPDGVRMTDADGDAIAMGGGPLAAIRGLLLAHRAALPVGDGLGADFPPYFAGLVGSFSYDLARRFERLPALAQDDTNLPEMDLSFHDSVVAVDHLHQRLWVTDLPTAAERAEYSQKTLRQRSMARIEGTLARLHDPIVGEAIAPVLIKVPIAQQMSEDRFVAMVATAKDYIAAGDIFQANLSQRFSAPLGGATPWDLYRTLSAINPAPFACYFAMDDYQIVSSSPERLVALSGTQVEARPIAGTRPRSGDPLLDSLSGEALLAHPKERAEHVMLVDLMRNDLGRVCDYGSVKVSEFMTTEHYSHVIHIVSNVVGKLGPGMDAVALLKAVFPGGTITGAPKVRCMEIIEGLEPVRRGIYTGSAGYLSVAGDMDLNILIRSVLVQDGWAQFQTGAGIVADSDPAAEYEETLHKAAAMRRALGAEDVSPGAADRPQAVGRVGAAHGGADRALNGADSR